jgi:hypothetical protein
MEEMSFMFFSFRLVYSRSQARQERLCSQAALCRVSSFFTRRESSHVSIFPAFPIFGNKKAHFNWKSGNKHGYGLLKVD